MSEDLYELLKRKDAELSAYRELVGAMKEHLARAASEYEAESVYQKAYRDLDSLFYEHGFKTDGRWRGES